MAIWDTAGQERFHALGPIYYRDAGQKRFYPIKILIIYIDAALLVYSIDDLESFNKVQKWVKELRKIVGNDIIIAIAGNKCDKEKERAVTEVDAVRYAESVGATHFHTSAKLNKGLDDVFGYIARRMDRIICFK